MRLATERYFDDFLGENLFPVIASGAGADWCSIVVKTAGAPLVQGITQNQGAVECLLTASNEVQSATLYHGDVLSFLADNVQSFACRVQTTVAIVANELAWFGLCSAYNAVPDSTTYHAGFRIDGANTAPTAIAVDADDGTTDNDNTISELLLPVTSWQDFVIDFANGLSDVRFFAGDSAHNGKLTRLLPKTTFDCTKLAGHNLQPLFQIGKASGTGVPALLVDYCEILYKRS